jgi:hypothetical protein
VLPDLYKLVHSAHAANDRPVANGHMTRNLGVIAGNAIVANETIMGKMAIGHDEAVLTDHRLVTILGAPVHGHELPYGSPIPNEYIRVFSLELQVLRNRGDHSTRKNAAVPPDPRPFHDRNIRTDPGSFPDLYVLVDHSERVNLDIGSQFGVGMNVCMGMNHVNITKTPTMAGALAKLVLRLKNGFIFCHILLKHRPWHAPFSVAPLKSPGVS